MLALDDPRWDDLEGGYGTLYDCRPALASLESGEDAWPELWEELHHQGDVGLASYAAVPHLVRIAATSERDWNPYALASVIEVERHRDRNPPLPDWLAGAYHSAWDTLFQLALHDISRSSEPEFTRAVLGVLALARGDLLTGTILAYSDESEFRRLQADFGTPSKYRNAEDL